MKVNDYLFPHPVMGIGEGFKVRPKVEFNFDYIEGNIASYKFDYKIDINDHYLISLLESKQAILVAEVICSYTIFRKVFRSFTPNLVFEIPANELRSKVDIQVMLLANSEIANYNSLSFSNEYKNLSFLLEYGDLIAFLHEIRLNVDMRGTAASDFIKIAENKVDDYTRYDLEKDYLILRVPKKQLDSFKQLRVNPNLENILISSLIIPALVHALHNISEENENVYGDKQWFMALVDNCQNFLGTDYPDESEISVLVDQILKNPNNRLVEDLLKFLNN